MCRIRYQKSDSDNNIQQWRFARKRRRDSSSGEAGESAGEEKKDKKEEMAE